MTDYPATFARTWPDLSLRRLDAMQPVIRAGRRRAGRRARFTPGPAC